MRPMLRWCCLAGSRGCGLLAAADVAVSEPGAEQDQREADDGGGADGLVEEEGSDEDGKGRGEVEAECGAGGAKSGDELVEQG